MEDNKKKRIMIIFGVFALIIVTTAASFAFFTYNRIGNTTSTIIAGDIEFSFFEGENVTLRNAFPVPDSVGAVDTANAYSFTVGLKSSAKALKTTYNVSLLTDNSGTEVFNNNEIKYNLAKDGTYVIGSATSGELMSSIDGFNNDAITGSGVVLSNQEINTGEIHGYTLRIWIDEATDYTNTIDTNGTMTGTKNSYTYSVKVKVDSNASNQTIAIENVNVTDEGIITASISDKTGLKAYAVTTSSDTPDASSTEWITIDDTTALSNNIKKLASSLITTKEISYTAPKVGDYYIHVKNNNDEVLKKLVSVTYIKKEYIDNSGANIPDLASNMIPVVYNETSNNWVKADIYDKWYDYDTQMWANAVTVSESSRSTYLNATAGTAISMNDINTMWVWIPRYEYVTPTSTTATEVLAKFVSDTSKTATSGYTIHPSFTFGSEELTGVWVAKFEASSINSCTPSGESIGTGCDVANLGLKIIPNVTSWRGIRPSTSFNVIRNMEAANNMYGFVADEVDTHMMKSTEWGMVAYLSQSKYGKYGNSAYSGANKEIYQNKSSGYIIGYSNGTPSTATAGTQVTYNVPGSGTGASTTGTIYGIYDMSGGSWEYVMGVMEDNTNTGTPISGYSTSYNSGFTGRVYQSGSYSLYSGISYPDKKYYDVYKFSTIDTTPRGLVGDAMVETSGWYGDSHYYVYSAYNWIVRGGKNGGDAGAGIFAFSHDGGNSNVNHTFRPVLVK